MSKHDPIPLPPNYFERSQRPLQALLFLLPMILLYELSLPAMAWVEKNEIVVSDIYARRLLYRFFETMGVTGYYLPGIIVVAVLLCWHLARRDPWKFEPRMYLMMLGESITLAVPMFVFQMVLFRTGALRAMAEAVLARATGGAAQSSWLLRLLPDWFPDLILSLGAGIYEEMLFRLIAITMMHMILVDFLKTSNRHAVPIVIGLSSILFAFYHFSEANPFQWGRFMFYTGAGVYFALIFVARGFGVAAGAHAMYDVLVVLLSVIQQRD